MNTETFATFMQEEHRWLSEHFDELIDQYAGKMVAIQGGKVVAVGDNATEIYRPFREAGQTIMPLLVSIPHPEEWDNVAHC